MLRNSVFYKSMLLFFVLLFVPTCLNAESQTTTFEEFNFAYGVLDSAAGEITDAKLTLVDYNNVRTSIVDKLEDNDEDMRTNVLSSFTGLGSAIVALGEQIMDRMDGNSLNSALNGVNSSIEEYIKNTIDVGIFQRQGDIDNGITVGYNQAYDNYVSAYDGLSRADRIMANIYLFNSNSDQKAYVSKLSVPDADTVFVTKCPNPSGKCYGYYPNPNEHKETCDGCNEGYYTCNEKDLNEKDLKEHQVLYCGRQIFFMTGLFSFSQDCKILGICGAKYRLCDNPKSKGIHGYRANWRTNYGGKYYMYKSSPYKSSRHRIGTPSPPAVSIYGPNGVGFSDSDFDASPTCDTCLDGSQHCPDARSNHPKEVPDSPASFSLKRGSARGSISLEWKTSDFDGNSPITDYEYKMDWKSNGSYTSWCDWTSAGTDMYELITGLHSNARYRVTMRARNSVGTSTSWSYKYINTR